MNDALFNKLGGESAVDAAVDIFYRKVLSDERISDFFDDVDMDRQAAKQKAFLTMAFGGPNQYSGLDMRRGHAHLVKKGLRRRCRNSMFRNSISPRWLHYARRHATTFSANNRIIVRRNAMANLSFNGNTYHCAEDQSVLDALTGHGVSIPSSCRNGICQTCMMQSVSGNLPKDSQNGLKETLKIQNYFLACSCHPSQPARCRYGTHAGDRAQYRAAQPRNH
jgi:truncated hemoglobin YjbI